MHVNRLKRYFDDLDTTGETPLTSAVAFEIFVQSPDRDFTHRLSRVMSALRKDRQRHPAPTQALLQIILCPCFVSTSGQQTPFQIEFIGDSDRARRVLCAAALIFVTGWDQLPPRSSPMVARTADLRHPPRHGPRWLAGPGQRENIDRVHDVRNELSTPCAQHRGKCRRRADRPIYRALTFVAGRQAPGGFSVIAREPSPPTRESVCCPPGFGL